MIIECRKLAKNYSKNKHDRVWTDKTVQITWVRPHKQVLSLQTSRRKLKESDALGIWHPDRPSPSKQE